MTAELETLEFRNREQRTWLGKRRASSPGIWLPDPALNMLDAAPDGPPPGSVPQITDPLEDDDPTWVH